MRAISLTLSLLAILLVTPCQANSLTDLIRSGAEAIVRDSQGHLPDSFIDDLAASAHVLPKSEVESILNITVEDERVVYINYIIDDCVVDNAIVAILPGAGVQEIWFLDNGGIL